MTAPCLVVASADELRDPDRLVSLVGRHRVTRTLCVPTLYGLLLDAAERAGTGPLASLGQVIVAGEALPRSLVDRHCTVHSPGVELVNEYGPTETTVWATYHRFTGAGPVSIGGPIPGARLHVLDDELQPVPPGTEGELFIGGAGVTRAYFGRPWATAAVFLDDPFAGEPGARMYRTDDIVRRNTDHGLDFIGRGDDQIKIRGHRVELGAVESTLRPLEGVQDAVVLPDARGSGLIGFVASREGADPVALRRALARELPSVMVPGELRVLPRNLNGKLDRAAADARRGTAHRPPLGRVPLRRSAHRPGDRRLVGGARRGHGAAGRQLLRSRRPFARHVQAAGRAGAALRAAAVDRRPVPGNHRGGPGHAHPRQS